MKKIHTYKIISNEKVGDRFICVCLDARFLAETGKPGQFLNVRVNKTLEPFFRRPFGIYQREDSTVKMLIEIRGRSTAMMAEKKAGETLDILGPLGKPFTLPPEHVKNIVLIAGGIGVAPLMSLSEALKNSGKNQMLLYGAKDQSYMFDFTPFKENGCEVHIATDDGSVGKKGRVSVLFDKIPTQPRETFIYTCGPGPMMRSAQQFAEEKNIAGECSCEEVMACGIGACLGCVVNTVDGYKTACEDGPVFDLDTVIFD